MAMDGSGSFCTNPVEFSDVEPECQPVRVGFEWRPKKMIVFCPDVALFWAPRPSLFRRMPDRRFPTNFDGC
jgi:hypothetical protein